MGIAVLSKVINTSNKVSRSAKKADLLQAKEILVGLCNKAGRNEIKHYRSQLMAVEGRLEKFQRMSEIKKANPTLPNLRKVIEAPTLECHRATKRIGWIVATLGPSFTTEDYFMESLLRNEGQARAYLRQLVKQGRLVEIKPDLFVKSGDHYQMMHFDAATAVATPKKDGTFSVTVDVSFGRKGK